MSSFQFSQRSETALQGVHPDLIRLARSALSLSSVDFGVTEGLRSMAREKEMVAEGHSETLHSRHLTGHAIDVVAYVNGAVSWDWSLYKQIAAAFEQASASLGIPVEWGGNWQTLKDGAHFQLPWATYPA
ncbi:M15 family metallopeptidase [Salmonella enterica subsp. enterica serovar Java]|nr:M15 family metallopeptidase [Salmonella enterica subsp. enterica serovar Kottbus]EDW4642212.1 M15 family metallopeptidase [Salmonella enterica subsp. enterica serovar Java]EEB1927897.1 M15 family metallopeptidase [Salmonella enterica subsp. enterica serovar Hvittingfoss]EHA9223818.1 M15 family metallopeptidase [Salmonella enterica subsp. enterica serovar Abony]